MAEELSDKEPFGIEWLRGILDVYAEARFLIEAGSVAGLLPDVARMADPWAGYGPCWTTVLMGEGTVL